MVAYKNICGKYNKNENINQKPLKLEIDLARMDKSSGQKRVSLKCLSIGTPNPPSFQFVPDGKWWLLGVQIIKQIIMRL